MMTTFQDYQKSYDLMLYKVFNILLVSSSYDHFILEKDGILENKLIFEYAHHDLQYAPRIHHATTCEEAISLLRRHRFEVVFSSIKIPDVSISSFVRQIKEIDDKLPVVLLANATDDISRRISKNDIEMIDNVFVWTGDPALFFAIAKLIEDRKNVDSDTKTANVRVIIIIEDNPRYYSSFLPIIYSEVFRQTRELIDEGLNLVDQLLRMRSRPKILLAKNFENAIDLFDRYRDNILGIISDISFPMNGKLNNNAGFIFAEMIKKANRHLPIILQSSEVRNRKIAQKKGALFIDKNSSTMLQDLRSFLLEYLGFGDFIFRNQSGQEIDRAASIQDLERILSTISEESLAIHSTHDHFSHWLFAHGEFELATILRAIGIKDFGSISDLRNHLISMIQKTRRSHQAGIISDFRRKSFDSDFSFLKISHGSMGGKARSIAFINSLLATGVIQQKFPNVVISVPKSLVIASDQFDEFLDKNKLRKKALSVKKDATLKKLFIRSQLPDDLIADLSTFLKHIKTPLAIRSSSLFEDSQDQPFAGLYDTYMLPNNERNLSDRLEQLTTAIKLIYASTFSKDARVYFENTSFRIEEEKMSVIVQEIVGSTHEKYFYPDFSGVARSYNYYPMGPMLPQDGVTTVALGFGKAVVDGNASLHFCPKYPEILPQFPTTGEFLKNTQKQFYALNMKPENPDLSLPNISGRFPLLHIKLAEKHGTLQSMGGVYSPENDLVYDGVYRQGVRIVNFSNILKNKVFPLAKIIEHLLPLISDAFGGPIEIEFAVNLTKDQNGNTNFYILQARHFLAKYEYQAVKIDPAPRSRILCQSTLALGNGHIEDISDIVYVKPKVFSHMKTREIAIEIDEINSIISKEKKPYMLIGIGRWGTADPFLGIPVRWAQISGARVILETMTGDFKVDPSHGTHFFHNLTACKSAYITVTPGRNEDFIDWTWLSTLPAHTEKKFIRHLRLDRPLNIRINGHESRAQILKPEKRADLKSGESSSMSS